ncbi:unnamed protein product [Chrysoparadoxa australica]
MHQSLILLISIFVLAFLAYNAAPADAAPGWVTKKQDETADAGMGDLDDGQLAALMDLMSGGDLDFKAILAESVRHMVEMFSDKEQRAQLKDPEVLDALVESLPPQVSEHKEVVKLKSMEPSHKKYGAQVEKVLDACLDYAREMEVALDDPDKLNKLLEESFENMGFTPEQMEMLGNPGALMEEATKLMQDPSVMKEMEAMMEMFKDPEALEQVYQDLMNDPQMAELMNSPEMQGMFEGLGAPDSAQEVIWRRTILALSLLLIPTTQMSLPNSRPSSPRWALGTG